MARPKNRSNIENIFKSIISIYQSECECRRTLPQQAKTRGTWDRLKVAMFPLDKELIDSITIGKEKLQCCMHKVKSTATL